MQIKNQLAKSNNDGKMSNFLANPAIKNMIANNVANSKQFCTNVLSLISNNHALANCDNASIVAAALLGESLKLSSSPTLGYFYCVPFNDKKSGTAKAQFILGYKGYVQLAIRTGAYKRLNVLPIKQGELHSWNALTEEIDISLIEDEQLRSEAPTIGYYACFEYLNGFRKAIYWSKEKMLSHAAQYSKAFNAQAYQQLLAGNITAGDMWKYSSFWYKDFDSMACKTMLRQLIGKWGITSQDLQKAIESDEQTLNANTATEAIEVSVEQAQHVSSAPTAQPEAINNEPNKATSTSNSVEEDPLLI